MEIEMVDLKGQYKKIQDEISLALQNTIRSAHFINGPEVKLFKQNLSNYLDGVYVIPCANGTDALQIALMSLDLAIGDEVIVPSFTYVATAEVLGLLKLTPVIVDVDPKTFTISIDNVKRAFTNKTKAIIPVHLYGQCADMDEILKFARENDIYVIEDTAQAIGAKYIFEDGTQKKAGTIGNIGCTSFFPSKNLGCYGDGGAIFTENESLANKIQMIANHGQSKKYIHDCIGVNSRLDSLQASILNVKLKYLDQYNYVRQVAASRYDDLLSDINGIELPSRSLNSSHVFHQYTLIIKDARRDSLKRFLEDNGIPSMIYYPIPLNEQKAYKEICKVVGDLEVTKRLCKTVLSIPMHTELTHEHQVFIANKIKQFLSS